MIWPPQNRNTKPDNGLGRILGMVAELAVVKIDLLKLQKDHKKIIDDHSQTAEQQITRMDIYINSFSELTVRANEIIQNLIAKAEKIKLTQKGDPGESITGPKPSEEELVALIKRVMPTVKDGVTPSEETLRELIKGMIPEVKHGKTPIKGLDYKDGDNADPETTANLVLEKLMGKKFKLEHIEGLEQTLGAIRKQTEKGYLHGSGIPALSAGAGIQLIPLPGGGYQVVNTAGGGTGVYNESPTGTVDGANKDFVLAHTPIAGSIQVYINGQRLGLSTDFTLTLGTITFIMAPINGSIILVDYLY